MHVGAFVFELLDVEGFIFDFSLKTLNFLNVWFDGFVEGSRQWVWCRHLQERVDARGIVGALLWSLDGQGIVLLRVLGGSGGGTVVLKAVLRIVCTGILGIFVWWTLVVGEGIGSVRHWEVVIVFGRRSVARQTTEPRHGAKEWNGGLME